MFFKVKFQACVDIDSVEQIDANGSQKLGQNDANRGKKSPNLCILCLEITKRMQNDPNFGVSPNWYKENGVNNAGNHQNIDRIKKEIKHIQAYSSVFDTISSEAIRPVIFPQTNSTDVIPAALKQDTMKNMIVQFGFVDIRNLQTKLYFISFEFFH